MTKRCPKYQVLSEAMLQALHKELDGVQYNASAHKTVETAIKSMKAQLSHFARERIRQNAPVRSVPSAPPPKAKPKAKGKGLAAGDAIGAQVG